MSEKPSDYARDYASDGLDSTGEFFTIGAPLHAVRPGYIRRPADDQLYDAIIAGRYAHVIAPNRTGKSSLIAATSARLQNNGFRVATLDLAQISERDGGSDPGRWYYSFAYRLLRQLRLKIDLQNWWQDKSIVSNRQRLVEFYVEVILENISEPVVVFVDEIQSLRDKPFAEHLLASIREACNSRTTEPEFLRLTFVLAGECEPESLVTNPSLSPFAVSQEIRLGDFTRDDLDAFAMELNLSRSDAALALDRIYYWTSGHPYLSQKLARAVARERISGNIKEHVDRIALHQLANRAALQNEPHLSRVHRRVVSDRKNGEALLNLYGRLRKGIVTDYDPESRPQRILLAIGLVVADESGRLRVRNRLYRVVFTARWANENLPLHWRGPVIAVLIALAVTAVPFWYTQLLPRPYMRVLSSPTLELEAVNDAFVNLSSFPGHSDTALRLFRNHLQLRAGQAADVGTIRQVEQYARALPDSAGFAEELLADFWDARVDEALRTERRDEALVASLESLIVSTPERRRRAATLIGDDYSLLVGTVPSQDAERLVFEPESLLASFVSGSAVEQWAVAADEVQPRQQMTLLALEVTPLVRRLMVDRSGQVSRLGLTLNVGHARLDDLRVKLIAPSGRTAELVVDKAASSASDVIRFERSQLSPLVGEPLNGTWSLSIRDETGGVTGHLFGWELSLDSQVAVESFERGLDIPDPVARESDDIWLDPDGRYAIARARQSDSARIWDLGSGLAERTIAVPASEQVLGLTAGADFLVTQAQSALQLWRTADGRRYTSLDIGAGSSSLLLSGDRRHVLVVNRGDANTEFRLWSLDTGRIVSRLAVAGVPALVAIDGAGGRLAIADYDRAVRIWDLADDSLVAQIALNEQPTSITLSHTGDTLGVVHRDSGFSLWRTATPQEPLASERGAGNWILAFSPSGSRVVAGNSRQGFQVYRSADGRAAGPSLGSGLQAGAGSLLAFSRQENLVVTGDPRDRTRFWRAPPAPVAVAPQAAADAAGHRLWRKAGDSVSAIAPGGEKLAIGDSQGHVHILHVNADEEELAAAGDEVSYLGHRSRVVALTFSGDGSLVASAGATGTVRIWDTDTGLPRPFHAGGTASTIDRIQFSPDASRLAVLSGARVWIMDVRDGQVLVDMELGERHADLAFAENDQLFLGGESGMLRLLASDRTGSWNLRNVWAGSAPFARLVVSDERQLLALVDVANVARLLNLRTGRIGSAELKLPDAVYDLAFSPGESRLLLRTARWLHRANVSPSGLTWLDAIRTPKVMPGSRMAFEAGAPGRADPTANRVMLLTRDAGFAEVAVLDFTYETGPTLFGSHEELLAEWRGKLGMALP